MLTSRVILRTAQVLTRVETTHSVKAAPMFGTSSFFTLFGDALTHATYLVTRTGSHRTVVYAEASLATLSETTIYACTWVETCTGLAALCCFTLIVVFTEYTTMPK